MAALVSVLVVPRYGSGAGAGSIHFRRIKRLRASTYGRGIWEFWSDFQAAFSNNPLTVFVGQTAVFAGTLTGSNGYTSSVDLSCTAPTALVCIVSPNKTTPTTSGVSITVTVTGPAGDYALNVAGTDPSGVAHNFPLTLHVVNFHLTPPAPSSITVNRPNSSVPVSFQATAAGSFGAAVDLSCTGLPSGATCNFQPSSTIFPTSASPVPVTLTISTSTVTPSGVFPLTINGATSGLNRTQNLSLTVTANADYTLVISNPSQSAIPLGAVTFNSTLTAFNGYGSTVNLSCGTGAPPTCTPSPASVTPTSGGVVFTVSASSNLGQNYSFDVVGQGTDSSATLHSYRVTLSSIFDFNLTNSSGAQTTKAGLSATYNLHAAPLGGNFPNLVTLSCTGLPARSTCSFNPAQVNSGSGDTAIILTIATNAPIPVSAKLRASLRLAAYALLLPGVLVVGGFKRWLPKSRWYSPLLLLPLMLLMIGLLQACGGRGGAGGGGGGQPGTSPGDYTITVTAKSGLLTHTVSAALTVQ